MERRAAKQFLGGQARGVGRIVKRGEQTAITGSIKTKRDESMSPSEEKLGKHHCP